MRRLAVTLLAPLMAVTLAIGTVAAVGNTWKAPPFSAIGVHNFAVDGSFRDPGNESVLSIFVETGSLSPNCLVSLNEIAGNASDVGTIFCSSRYPDFGDGNVAGVWLHVFFFEDPGPELYLALNVYQEGARFYSGPTYCSGESGC